MKKFAAALLVFALLVSSAVVWAESEVTTDTGIWEKRAYVDEFDLPTDEYYISNAKPIVGKFSNSATTDSELLTYIYIDKGVNYNDISLSFKLIEYGNNVVKNAYSRSLEYDVAMMDGDEEKYYFSAFMPSGKDQIYVDAEECMTVLTALCGPGTIRFVFTEKENPTSKYSFIIEDSSGLGDLLPAKNTGIFSDGMCQFWNIMNLHGYINTSGEIVIPCIYSTAYDFCAGIAPVCKDDQWGVIDTNGEVVIPFGEYESIGKFKDGMSVVKKDGKFGYIVSTGALVIPCEFDAAYDFGDWLACVYSVENRMCGYIDKTGTLTQNQVVLERHYDLDMQETPQILKFSYLNAYYQTGVKDLIDKAVIDAAGDELDVNEIQRDYNKIDEIPFDYTRKRMSVVVVDNDEHHGQHLLVTKGAAEGMLAISNKVELNGKVEDLTSEWKERILNQINELNDDGLRVLLVGYKLNPAPVGEFSAKDEHDLTIIGYLAYLDPPKETTKEALEDLKNDNVDVKIFTGDNEAVTRAIALQVGLNVDTVYDGKQIDEASPEELKEIVEKCDIFVHLTPELRVKIINALKTNGHTVGYMGDGNKDALAMKVADVTVTSNSSVDITKESADIVFEQKDLQLLEEMIMVGRKVFSNTMKYIKTFLVTNMGSIIAMAVFSLLLPFLPLLPLQVLILNLLFSLSCLVIPFDSVSENYVKKPQKWSIRMWPKFVLNFGPIPAIVDFIAMALMFYVICPYLVGSNYHHWVFISLFYSGIFVESLWTRVMIIHTLRDERFPFLKQHATPIVFLVTFGLAILGTMLPSSSIAPSLGLTQLPFSYWAVVLLLEVIYILLTTLVKHLYLRKEKF